MITRYFANNKKNKNPSLSTGFETEAEARKHAVTLAETYGGVSVVSTNKGERVAEYSFKKGWK